MNAPVKTVDVVIRAPAGSCGFRRGYWTAIREDGSKFRFYSSIPHKADLETQRQMLCSVARRLNGE